MLYTGKSIMGERCYDLMVNGKKVGYAHAKVSTSATGLHKVKGTTYTAFAYGQHFGGSRASVKRDIERKIAADTKEPVDA
jgi:hypothetical protein